MTDMSRKDFKLIAEAIATFEPPFCERNQTGEEDWEQIQTTRTALAEHFANKLRYTNPYFNRERFMKAATDG